MRATFLTFVFALCLLPGTTLAGGEQQVSPSALEADPTGWIDLTANGLKDWKRVSIPPGSKLKKDNPWSFDAATGVIHCAGVGYHEMLVYDKEMADGIFHVEWRFHKVEGKKGYNSGVYARNSVDGEIWHQAQVGSKNVGHIFGNTPVDGANKRISTKKLKGEQRGQEAGEWNTYEITCRGNTLTLWVNGAVTTIWDACAVPSGYFGMEAEGWKIEFKNAKFKPLKTAAAQTATINMFPGKNLKGWKRVPLAPDTELSKRNPWSVDEKKRLLLCDGVDIKEMLLFDRPLADGVFHVEWRFRPVPDKTEGYNSGVYVRSANDGKVWLQVQTAELPKHPRVGDLFGDFLVNGEIKRVLVEGTGSKHAKPVGEWNTFDIHCQGTTITTVLNGETVCVMKDCPLREGYFGLQAEFFFIEFKGMEFRLEKK